MIRCAISGQIPIKPVITPRGVIFERETIENHLKTSNTCPMDGQPLMVNDLIEIQNFSSSVYPAQIRANSFSGILASLQEEWNAVQKETFSLRQKLAQCQKELAQAIYEKEAAKRVIARLISQNGSVIPPISVPTQSTIDIAKYLELSAKSLIKTRKPNIESMKSIASGLIRSFAKFKVQNIQSVMHDRTIFTALDKNPDTDLIIGTSEGTLIVYDTNNNSVKIQIQAHRDSVVSIASSGNRKNVLTASRDGTICLFDVSQLETPSKAFETGKIVVHVDWHPKYGHFYVFFEDGTWTINDISTMEPVDIMNNSICMFLGASVHCDGALLATIPRESNSFMLWNAAAAEKLISNLVFEMPSTVTSVAMSPCGYYMAANCAECVRIWLLTNPEISQTIETPSKTIMWDNTGFVLTVISENLTSMYLFDKFKDDISMKPGPTFESGGDKATFSIHGSYIAQIRSENNCLSLISS